MIDREKFLAAADQLANGPLREAIGYRIEYPIPYYQGIVGYMVEAPMLCIRHSRFPILFIAYDQRQSDILTNVVKQVEIARATEYFALLIVVPTRDWSTGNEALQLRRALEDSVYRHDFVVLDRDHLAKIVADSRPERLIEIILEQGIELSTLSPYVVQGPVSDRMFFGREREIRTISQNLVDKDFAITGARRIGKSSVLLKLRRLLNSDPRYSAVYVNCEDKFGYEDFFQAFADTDEIPVSFEPSGFRQIAARLSASAAPKRLVFLFDEVDELLACDAAAQPSTRLFKTFRTLSHEEACRFVFSGARTLYHHLRSPKSPFFNFCQHLTLSTLEKRSVAEIAVKPMHQLGIDLPDEEGLISRLIDVTSCHPNLTQWICDKLLKVAISRRVAIGDLENVCKDPGFYDHYVGTAWGDSTPLERLISILVEGPVFRIDEIVSELCRFGITDQERIWDALQMLQLGSLLQQEGTDFRFRMAGFPTIVRSLPDFTARVDALRAQVASPQRAAPALDAPG
jgi:hypothetical protein